MQKAFVNSLPKSGTNLIIKCLLLFGYAEKDHISAGSLFDRNPSALYRRLSWRKASDGYVIGVNSPVRVKRRPIDRLLGTISHAEFISAHVGHTDDLLNAVLARQFKPIMIIRDPRAVLASFVPYVLQDTRHFLHRTLAAIPANKRYDAVLDGFANGSRDHLPLRECCRAVRPWVNHTATLTIRFEDIVGRKGGGSDQARLSTLRDLARHLEIAGDKIDAVAQNLFGPGRPTFRKGQIDSWREELPRPLQTRLNDELGSVLTEWGYTP